MDATRISDGRPVMLKMLPKEEGPHEVEISKLFSTEPLASDRRSHCVRLLDVIELNDDPPIIVHPLLRPFADPPLQTYGEFITFFSHTCEVSPTSPRMESCIRLTEYYRCSIYAREPRRPSVCRHRLHILFFLIWPILGTARTGT